MELLEYLKNKITKLKDDGWCEVQRMDYAMVLMQILSEEYYGFTMNYGVNSQNEYWNFCNTKK